MRPSAARSRPNDDGSAEPVRNLLSPALITAVSLIAHSRLGGVADYIDRDSQASQVNGIHEPMAALERP
ncbi:hypothetical protein [Kibdelosporangium phytohabitans]|uniref:hypothetical protein n=1 Tax=Kibdelosporangium phytohabitans TaxID=860235 RepID=UPI00147054C3